MAAIFMGFMALCVGIAVAPRETTRIALVGLWLAAIGSMVWGIGSALLAH
jgi:hypothetical protein